MMYLKTQMERIGRRVPLRSLETAAWLVLMAAPFVVFAAYVLRYAVNIPIEDDYGMYLRNTISFLQAPSLKLKLYVLYAQRNEHRMVLDKLAALAQVLLTGKVNFRSLTLAGDAGYFVFIVVLCWQLWKLGLRRWQLLPVPYVLLAFTQYQIMFFATPAVQFYWGNVFALLCLICLAVPGRLGWACALYAAAVFTTGSAVVLFPLGLAFLLVQRRWKEAWVFAGVGALISLAYVYHYQPPPAQPPLRASLLHFDQAIQFFLAALGGSLLSLNVAVVAGTLLLAVLVALMVRRPEDGLMWLLAGWVLLTAAGLAAARLGWGIENALASRYSTNSLIAITAAYAWLMLRQNAQPAANPARWAVPAALLAMGFFAGVVLQQQALNRFGLERDAKIAGLVQLAKTGQNNLLDHPQRDVAQQLLLTSQSMGIYDYAATGLALRHPVGTRAALPKSKMGYAGYLNVSDAFQVEGWAIIPDLASKDAQVWLLLKNDQHVVMLPTTMVERPDVSQAMGASRIYDYSGYKVFPGAYNIPAGSYRMGQMVRNGDAVAIHWEDAPIVIP